MIATMGRSNDNKTITNVCLRHCLQKLLLSSLLGTKFHNNGFLVVEADHDDNINEHEYCYGYNLGTNQGSFIIVIGSRGGSGNQNGFCRKLPKGGGRLNGPFLWKSFACISYYLALIPTRIYMQPLWCYQDSARWCKMVQDNAPCGQYMAIF